MSLPHSHWKWDTNGDFQSVGSSLPKPNIIYKYDMGMNLFYVFQVFTI